MRTRMGVTGGAHGARRTVHRLAAATTATALIGIGLAVAAAPASAASVDFTCRFASGTTAFQFATPVTVTLSPAAPKANKSTTATITYANGFKNGPVALPAGNLFAESTLKINGATTKMKMTHATQGNPTDQAYSLPPAKVTFKAKSGANTIVLTQVVHWHSVFGLSASTKCVPPGGSATVSSFTASAGTTSSGTKTGSKSAACPPGTTIPNLCSSGGSKTKSTVTTASGAVVLVTGGTPAQPAAAKPRTALPRTGPDDAWRTGLAAVIALQLGLILAVRMSRKSRRPAGSR